MRTTPLLITIHNCSIRSAIMHFTFGTFFYCWGHLAKTQKINKHMQDHATTTAWRLQEEVNWAINKCGVVQDYSCKDKSLGSQTCLLEQQTSLIYNYFSHLTISNSQINNSTNLHFEWKFFMDYFLFGQLMNLLKKKICRQQ